MSFLGLLARTIFTPTERIEDGCVLIRDGQIVAVAPRIRLDIPTGAAVTDFGDALLAPGFIDLHVHGAGGRDVMEGNRDALVRIGQTLRQHGTTSYLATTLTAPVEETLAVLERLSATLPALRAERRGVGALPLGIHLEGPFISRRRPGVHPEAFIQPASYDLLRRILDAARGEAKILTLAPEVEGAEGLMRLAKERGLVVALGHSDATYEETLRAIEFGASHTVHLFNAMRGFHHREPGIVGAILSHPRVTAELIADGLHVHPAALQLAVGAKGPERLILVSDGTSATGMPDGSYPLGSIRVTVRDGVSRNEEGKLAGSVLTLDRALRNMRQLAGVELPRALAMLTLNPARVLGLDGRKGVIAPGADADLVCLDSNLQVCGTVIRGEVGLSST